MAATKAQFMPNATVGNIVLLKAVTPGAAGNLINVSWVQDLVTPNEVTVELTAPNTIVFHYCDLLRVYTIDAAINLVPEVAALIYIDVESFNALCEV